uniref:Retinol dehydrogenase 13 n=1 Tax=Hucho hucho TaxID=62062 RepID=A0A4W5QIX6_9TELE
MSKYILPVSVFGTVFGCAVLLKNHVTGGPCPSKAKIPGKTVVITGANTGIGKETAKELAKRGGRIIMGCRDMEKCETAAKEIRGQTLNPHVYARHIDLASIKSIRQFAERVNQEEKHVDVLINNAGVMRCPAGKTEDGFDIQFGVNHLGHFLLTNLLLEKLKDSAPSRVVNLTSLAHIVGEIDFNDLNWDNKKFDTKRAYCQSKLANVLFTRELAQRLEGKSSSSVYVCGCSMWVDRFVLCLGSFVIFVLLGLYFILITVLLIVVVTGTGVTVNCLHPGVVATELGRHTGLHQSQFSSSVLSPFFTLLVKGPELGAQPSVYLAVAEELEGVTGCYYDVMMEKEPAPKALDQEVSRRLWEASARLMGLEQAPSAAVPASNGAQEKPSTDPDTKIIVKHPLSVLEQTGMNPGV